ncbi:hypothetical protein FRB95_013466 [Tulasnella sp. JGI-2019a]|nr:hypothetical protein FRB95_013466 [Tulasnella sp. JGI-2019a]
MSPSARPASAAVVQSSSYVITTASTAEGSSGSPAGTTYTPTPRLTIITGRLVAPNSHGGSKASSGTLAIAVGIVAGLFAPAVAFLVYLFVRRNKRTRDHLFDDDPSPEDQHAGGIAGDQPGMEEPHLYHVTSVIVPYGLTSSGGGGGGDQAIDGSFKVE